MAAGTTVTAVLSATAGPVPLRAVTSQARCLPTSPAWIAKVVPVCPATGAPSASQRRANGSVALLQVPSLQLSVLPGCGVPVIAGATAALGRGGPTSTKPWCAMPSTVANAPPANTLVEVAQSARTVPSGLGS